MPFGLTNAYRSFHGLMNYIFKPTLGKLLLVFFYGILIYKKYWEEHIQHVDRILTLLEEKKLYTKCYEYAFRVQEVEYLCHNVSHEGFKLNPKKIKVVREWPISKTLYKLKGFLRLKRYYHKFVKNYGQIATPLTKIFKKKAWIK